MLFTLTFMVWYSSLIRVVFISEVERELGLLFSKGGSRRSSIGNQTKQSRSGSKFQMLVEDIREGVLVSA